MVEPLLISKHTVGTSDLLPVLDGCGFSLGGLLVCGLPSSSSGGPLAWP
ncbi:MAG: hypothetical protein ACP5L1_09320 [Caldivirga sp.]